MYFYWDYAAEMSGGNRLIRHEFETRTSLEKVGIGIKLAA
jgi:hypothetical protein